jgi:DNA-binding CsgD family transcriptional regulator
VREFGLEQLAGFGEEEAARDAHADYFLTLAERAEPELTGANQYPWFDRLVRERPNLRAALGWLRDRGDGPRLYRLAGALGLFWTWAPFRREGRAWLEAALAVEATGVPPRDVARVLSATAVVANWQGDVARAAMLFDQALVAWRAIGDPLEIAHTLRSLGGIALHTGDLDRADDLVTESLARFRQLGDAWSIGLALATWGTIASTRGDPVQAIARNEEALALFAGLPGQRHINLAQVNLAWEHLRRGDQENARHFYREVLAYARAEDDRRDLASTAEGAAGLAAAAGEWERAAGLFAAAARLREVEELPHLPSKASQLAVLVDTVRDALGERAFAAAWRAGEALPLVWLIAETEAVLNDDACAAAAEPATAAADPAADGSGQPLTRQQLAVLRLIVAGKTDREIATTLSISRRTASKHVSAVLAALDVPSRSAAAAAAVQRGLV